MKTTSDLIMIAGSGANLIIDAKSKSVSDIITIVGSIGLKDSHITIKNSSTKSVSEILIIARTYPKNITFDFSE
ncbi:hypothetical protein ABIB40_004151 [Pedobacter sp. UYP30]|uniref:hypothetical protein n=1 Tax=Pedobacter sp. UYP30 TaxID=1756400 RepID=UPI0033928A1E